MINAPTILGVDPGKASTGWALLSAGADDRALASGASEHVPASEIRALVLRADAVAIEDQAGGFPSSIIPLAFERGRWTAIAQLAGIPVIVVNPATWQKRFFADEVKRLRGLRKRPCPSPVVPPGKRKARACKECETCEQNRVIDREKREGSKSWKAHYTEAARKRFGVGLEDAAAACWIAALVLDDAAQAKGAAA